MTAARVCVLTSVHSPLDGRIFHRESTTLAEAGYQVTLLAPSDDCPHDKDDVQFFCVPRPRTRRGRPLVWLRLWRRALRLRPDVIHFHDPELLLLVPWFRLAFGRRVKIVYDVHEYFVDSLAGKYWIPRRLRPFARLVAGLLERLLVRGVDGIVCAVDGQAALYQDFAGPVAVVRNLPHARIFRDAHPHPALAGEGFKLIYVGLILPKRGIDVLLEMMRRLRADGVRGVRLFLIGPDTSPAYIEHIRSFAAAHRLSDQVHWLGAVPHEELKHYLVAADVGLIPGLVTRQYKNPGLTTKLFEYMLCGLPVVSADYPHRRVYIEEADCGLVVPPEDAAAWADAVLWLRDHPVEARAMGERGRAVVLSRYTWEREQSRLLSFYRTLLGAPQEQE